MHANSGFGNPYEIRENSKIQHYVEKRIELTNKTCSLSYLGSIHARYARNEENDEKTFKSPKYEKSIKVFRQQDGKEAPYTFRVKFLDGSTFLQRSDLLQEICQTLDDQKKQLKKEARKFWVNCHERIAQIEFFDNTGLVFNRVGFTRRTFSPEGKPTGVKVWKKKNSDFWEE
jgi:hypothetical protein